MAHLSTKDISLQFNIEDKIGVDITTRVLQEHSGEYINNHLNSSTKIKNEWDTNSKEYFMEYAVREITSTNQQDSEIKLEGSKEMGGIVKTEDTVDVKLKIENEELNIKDEKSVTDEEHRLYEISFTKPQAIKVGESSKEIVKMLKMEDTVDEGWKIKKEGLNIKEEKHVTDEEHSVSPKLVEQQKQKKSAVNGRKKKKLGKIFTCDECEYNTIDRMHLDTHLEAHKKHEETFKFKCEFCRFKTTRKYYLIRHIKDQHKKLEGNVFKGYQCDYQTVNRHTLNLHIFKHIIPCGAAKLYECDQCDYQTHQKTNLIRHQLLHKNADYKCELCDYQTVCRDSFKRHILRHINPEIKFYKCNQCNYQTLQKESVKIHSLKHENSDQVKFYKCNECDYQTVCKHNIKIHSSRHKNPDQFKFYKCIQCDYQTVNIYYFRRHLQQHLNHKKLKEFEFYECKYCDFKTLFIGHFRRHCSAAHH